MLTNRNVVAVNRGHIRWMIVVLCWSHRIGCERDNDVLLFHTRISVLTSQGCVSALLLLLGGIPWRRTQQKVETNVILEYGNCFGLVKGKSFAAIKINFDICVKKVHNTEGWVGNGAVWSIHVFVVCLFSIKKKSNPITGLDRPWGFQVDAPRISRQSAREGGKFVSPTNRSLLPPVNIPGTHFY
jgi:hypothetical protein